MRHLLGRSPAMPWPRVVPALLPQVRLEATFSEDCGPGRRSGLDRPAHVLATLKITQPREIAHGCPPGVRQARGHSLWPPLAPAYVPGGLVTADGPFDAAWSVDGERMVRSRGPGSSAPLAEIIRSLAGSAGSSLGCGNAVAKRAAAFSWSKGAQTCLGSILACTQRRV
jgi:hypothetical protein